MWWGFGGLALFTLLGLSAAWYNLNNHEARAEGLRLRRIERKNRKSLLKL